MEIGCNILANYGINGSLRRRDVQALSPYTEYYMFNSAANLKAYSNNGLDFAYYGYNATNTRTYKLNFLNANSWVNGQQLPIHPQSVQAMFYPNAYLNFNQNGEYTKHYYNGAERIASRLGDNQQTIEADANDRLLSRIAQTDEIFKAQIGEMAAYEEPAVNVPARGNGEGTRNLLFPTVGYDPIPAFSDLQPTGNPDDIFYYHTNHLGSTAFVTDNNATITQGFLYAPFGEITTEFAPLWQNGTIPKYSFNAKELDEETGMYYYEARYYKPPVFTSRDPMFEKYFWMTPYAYCANNPVKYVDPSGRDYITKIDQKNKTITIRAKYYTSKENEAELEKALDVWNRQSKKYYYVVGKGKDKQKYAINFDLQITSYETQEKAKRAYNNDESGMANFYDGRTYKGEDRGETNNGRFIHLNENNALIPNSNRTLSHEVGHSIGLSEWEHGLMESGGTEEWICKDFISQILSTAGFNMCVPMVSIGGNTCKPPQK